MSSTSPFWPRLNRLTSTGRLLRPICTLAAAYPSTARRNVGIREIALRIPETYEGQPWRSDTLDVNASGTGADIKPTRPIWPSYISRWMVPRSM